MKNKMIIITIHLLLFFLFQRVRQTLILVFNLFVIFKTFIKHLFVCCNS